ncbi:hypothetical protein D0860_07962 [Hortaea werneckii]|uniref:BTB domain-containing protein n=1 Tax=Hortaea werneckii TaxID=91943 RepID=A0A3M7GH87_HORWE|nr:hypothetical protein D0860_07962 [Hortaea werneckii]
MGTTASAIPRSLSKSDPKPFIVVMLAALHLHMQKLQHRVTNAPSPFGAFRQKPFLSTFTISQLTLDEILHLHLVTYQMRSNMPDGQQASNEALQRMLKTGEYSDLMIKCGDRTFEVHKNIVCAISEYFAAACATGTIELKSSADLNAAKDDLSLDDPAAVKLMIDFLYLHDYPTIRTCLDSSEACNAWIMGVTDHNPGDAGAIMHANVYALGCKYQIPSLQSAALKKFEEAAALAWATDEFVHAVHLVHSTTPDSDKGLRDITARVIVEHGDELCTKLAMEAVVRSFDGLAYNLMKEMTKRSKKTKGPKCLTCNKISIRECEDKYYCGRQSISCNCYDRKACGGYYCEGCLERKGHAGENYR